MSLHIEFEVRQDGLRIRCCRCMCSDPDCHERALVASEEVDDWFGRPLDLWLYIAKAETGRDARRVAREALIPDQRLLIHKLLLIHGAAWCKIDSFAGMHAQVQAVDGVREDIIEADDSVILSARAFTFGDDFTRTALALEAIDDVDIFGGRCRAQDGEAYARIMRARPMWEPS